MGLSLPFEKAKFLACLSASQPPAPTAAVYATPAKAERTEKASDIDDDLGSSAQVDTSHGDRNELDYDDGAPLRGAFRGRRACQVTQDEDKDDTKVEEDNEGGDRGGQEEEGSARSCHRSCSTRTWWSLWRCSVRRFWSWRRLWKRG